MRLLLFVAAVLGLSQAASAATASGPANQVVIPAYGSIRNIDDYATEAAYRAAAKDRRFVLERIAYSSDGLTVYAYVYRPRGGSAKLPVIIFNRGSWTWPEGFAGELLTMANRLARNGYLVIAPMYRGSGGAGGRDEMGGADLADLFNLLPVITAMPRADAGRIYLYGESRGGMMVYQALRDGFPARAAAVVGAFTDLEGMLADPQWAQFGPIIWPELDRDRTAILKRRSALQWPERLNRPILIIHGAEDSSVPAKQSLDLAGRLTALGKPYQLMIVAGEGHTIARRAADRDDWVMDWFARHPGKD